MLSQFNWDPYQNDMHAIINKGPMYRLHSLLDCLQDFAHLLICGDFKVNWSSMTVYQRNCHIECFLDKIHDQLFLFQHVIEPRMGTTPSLLNLVFINEAYMVKDIRYLPGLGNTDHACLCFSLLCYAHLKDKRILRYNRSAH